MTKPDTDQDDDTKRLIVNPKSGEGEHLERTLHLAREYGFGVRETAHAGHAIELAQAAANDGVELLAVCGGDGTVHEVVRGLVAADALEKITLAIVPAGTANIIAGDYRGF